MVTLDPSMVLKVKRDTFYLAEPNVSVYFRNNSCSFRLEGSGIDQWVEKLLPMFNGEYSLGNLTNGLQEPYRQRVYQIAEVLLQNGFVRDVSKDEPHQLSEQVLKKFASQIEFVDNLAGSGPWRFQSFRNAKVLAIGSGPMLNSLVSSLLDSGLKQLNVSITSDVPTNRKRLTELAHHARKTDSVLELHEWAVKQGDWRELLRPYDSVLYVSQNGNLEELRKLQSICREEKKTFIPAVLFKQSGIAGPIFNPDSDASWESAWRRLHTSVRIKEQEIPAVSSTTGALLANVITFELFKDITGVTTAEQKHRIYLLDIETLEGSWHSFLPHPLEKGEPTAIKVEDPETRIEHDIQRTEPEKLLHYFSLLTSKETGILHVWEEGDLTQLPLAQCRVQAADPISDGPAELLEAIVCNGLTHEEARIEAALAGIEDYAGRLAGLFGKEEFQGIGAGETFVEGLGRGLQKCLAEKLNDRKNRRKELIYPVDADLIEDDRCLFYMNALGTVLGALRVGIGEDVIGFPVIWVGTRNGWYGSTGLNTTMALRSALQEALYDYQNSSIPEGKRFLCESQVLLEERGNQSIKIPVYPGKIQPETLQSAIEVLKENRIDFSVCELRIESIFNQQLAGIFGVSLREEGLT
ncbi:putative thiazole-containing bacteriocin maturation protein [Mesobacillus jeotgali]|uniref:putative thiazole-containing bacteriocin maturation protein n=1 Tax=Mesobacillus jeotgali TaxID=129985 RepID=UPI001115EF69|nr:putative thiazole-containing bacteriocin maturation protein [Mesobacillus jeotgali]